MVARAAEAADAACPPDDPAAHCRAAAGALCHGRPALGRSVHAGVAQPPGRSRPHRPSSWRSVTFRPDFSPPWTGRAHLTQVTLTRLPRHQATEVTARWPTARRCPLRCVEQIVAKTDGVPLFVEELTKMVLESGLLQEREERYELTGPLPPLAIPATLHDSLMARLDRLAAVKALAQLGATLGREFSYALLHAVAPVGRGDRATGAAPVGRGGVPVPAGAAAAGDVRVQACAHPGGRLSVLAAEHTAAVPSAHCPGIGGAVSRRSWRRSPSCVAHHYTEAGCAAQAVAYWQRAGSRPASARPIWKPSAT